MKIYDMHIHSNNSLDANSTVDEICGQAIKKGIAGIAITDHVDTYGLNDPENYEHGNANILIPQSFADVEAARIKYGDKLEIIKGIELGQPCLNEKLTKNVLDYGETDLILASVHANPNGEDYYFMDMKNIYDQGDIDGILNEYFNQLLDTAKSDYYDSLAHLTYPLRYIYRDAGIKLDIEKYRPIIAEILQTVIKKGKAIEINTSSLKRAYGDFVPGKEIINLYKSMGGEFITIGSDAHNAKNIADGFSNAADLLKKCGFTHYTYYKGHEPIQIPID